MLFNQILTVLNSDADEATKIRLVAAEVSFRAQAIARLDTVANGLASVRDIGVSEFPVASAQNYLDEFARVRVHYSDEIFKLSNYLGKESPQAETLDLSKLTSFDEQSELENSVVVNVVRMFRLKAALVKSAPILDNDVKKFTKTEFISCFLLALDEFASDESFRTKGFFADVISETSQHLNDDEQAEIIKQAREGENDVRSK